MPQVVAAIVTFVTWVAGPGLAAFAVRTAIVFGISKLVTDRAMKGADQNDAGARVQLPPATNNILPLVYGKAYVSPVITDAKISADQKTMWYCCALSEVPSTGAYTFGDIYWNGNRVTLSGSSVTGMTNNAGQFDSKMAGKINIYKFPNGSSSGINTGGQTAIQIMSDTQIPANLRWSSLTSIYTTGDNAGKTASMTNTAFLIVRLEYNVDADTTGLGTLDVELTNSISKPGDVFLDYLTNTRYGCAIPADNIDTASLTALNTYSDELITYTDVNGVSATQARYRVNGPVNIGNTCLTNLQEIADACDSWIQYSDIEDKWKIVINKEFDGLQSDLYHVTSEYDDTNANLIGGIQVNPIDLTASYNSMQVAYPNKDIRDQIDYQIFDFTEPGTDWYNPSLLSPNEPDNKLDVDFPQVNNYIQSAYLGVRKLLQSREDLVISFQTDYSGIQVQAGDVIRVTLAEYGWSEKLFRVSQVSELQDADYTLYAKITAFEYNATIYGDNALTDFVLEENTGLANPNIITTTVQIPEIREDIDDSVGVIECIGVVPNVGSILQIDFNWGEYFDSFTHDFYSSIYNADGSPLTAELNPGSLTDGKQYRIKDIGNTDFTSAGATKVELNNQPNLNGFLQKGQRYIINTVGSTDFTVQGAPNNDVGTSFVATSNEVAIGTGSAYQTDFFATGTALSGGLGDLSTTTGLVDTIFSVPMLDLPEIEQYWSITARTSEAAKRSANSNVVAWSGPTVTSVRQQDGCGVSSTGTTLNFTTAIDNVSAGANVAIDTSNALYIPTGVFASNTFVTKIVSNTEVILNTAPTTPLSNDCIKVTYLNPKTGQAAGGITAGAIHTGTITSLGDLDSLTVAGNVNFYGPNVALGAVGNMEITGGQNGYFLQTNGAGDLNWAQGTTTGNGVVGGANRQIQYNNDGNFAGSVGFEFDSTTNIMTVPTIDANLVVANVIDANIGNIDTVNGNLVGNWSATQWTTANLTSLNMPTPAMFMGSIRNFGPGTFISTLYPGSDVTIDGECVYAPNDFNAPFSFNRFGDATSPYPGRMVNAGDTTGSRQNRVYIPVMTNAITGNTNAIIQVYQGLVSNIAVDNLQGAGKNPVLIDNSFVRIDGASLKPPAIMLSTNNGDTELFLTYSNDTTNWTTVSTTALSSYSPIDCIGISPMRSIALLSDIGTSTNSKTVNLTTTRSGSVLTGVTIETGTIANIGSNTNPKHQLSIQNGYDENSGNQASRPCIAIPAEVSGQLGRIGWANLQSSNFGSNTPIWTENLMPTATLNATESFAYCVLWLETTNEWIISARDYDSVLATGSVYTFKTSDGYNFSTPVISVNVPTSMTPSSSNIIEGIQNFGNTSTAKQVRSYDNGETWVEISGSLPDWPAQCKGYDSSGTSGAFDLPNNNDRIIYTNAIPLAGYGMSANTASDFDNYLSGVPIQSIFTTAYNSQNSSSNPHVLLPLPAGTYKYLGGDPEGLNPIAQDYLNTAMFVYSSNTFPIPPG